MPDMSAKSLYERLGGYDVIAAIIRDFYARLFADPEIGLYFKGHSDRSRQALIQRTIEFFCDAAGGPVTYIGLDMKIAHTGLALGQAEWVTTGKHLMASLERFAVGQGEASELLTLIEALKSDVLERD
jgi:hemoglobin